MLSKLRNRLTYANVMSSIAVFLALTGGTAVALSGANTVFSDDIVDGEVRNPDLRAGAVTNGKLGDGAVSSGKVLDNHLTGKDVKGDTLTGADIDESSLTVGGGPPTLFAVVNGGTGEANYGHGVTNSEKIGTGQYTVTFSRSLVKCATIATAGTGNPDASGDTYQTGSTATVRSLDNTTVVVDTTPSGGGGPSGGPAVPDDRSFHLAVFC